MDRIKQLVKISRPRFWIYLIGPFLLGTAAGRADLTRESWQELLIFGLMFSFPANLLVYGINDIFDFETDRLNPKKAGYEVLVRPSYHKTLWWAIVLSFFVPMVALGLSASIPSIAWTALAGFIFFGCFYSAKPIRAKVRPGIDMIFNCLYVFPGVFSYGLLTGNFVKPELFVAGVLWCMAMHAYSAVPDIMADKKAELKTVATELGKRRTIILCALLYAGAGILSAKYLKAIAIGLLVVYLGMMIKSLQAKNDKELMKLYKFFPTVNTGSGFALFWYLLLRQN